MSKKPYSQLTTTERWHWHAEIYAFRRVVLGVPVDQRTSPCDEHGEWFDPQLIDAAEHRMRDKRRAETLAYQRQREREDDERGWFKDQRTGRQIADEWAQARGYADMDEYVHAERIDWSEACMRVACSILAAASMPGEPNARYDAAAALGVKAREYQPTAEQLKAGRRELGLEEHGDAV